MKTPFTILIVSQNFDTPLDCGILIFDYGTMWGNLAHLRAVGIQFYPKQYTHTPIYLTRNVVSLIHFRHEERGVYDHSSSVLHLGIYSKFSYLSKNGGQYLKGDNIWRGTIFLCTIFDVQYSCGQYLKHLTFALFWVLQICLQYCFWYPHIFSNLFNPIQFFV